MPIDLALVSVSGSTMPAISLRSLRQSTRWNRSWGETFPLDVRAYDMQNDPIRLSATTRMGGRFEDLGEGRGRYLDSPIRDAASDFAAARSHRWARLTSCSFRYQLPRPTDRRRSGEAAALRAGQVFERRLHATDPDGDGHDPR